jgi:nitrate/nitrite transporter NarK
MYRFQSDQLHLTDGEIGPMRSYSKLACALLAPSLGMLVDRVGGRRAMLIALPLCTFFPVVAFFGMHGYWSMLLLNFTLVIPGFLLQLVMGKWTVDMYPRAQYGQFASAGAAVGALGAAVVGVLFGWVLDKSGHNYRLCLLVPSIFSLIALGACLVLGWYWPDKTPEQEPGVPTEAQGGFEPVVAAAASDERA